MKEFNKRYDKFKKNNLPTHFWDEERKILEYVYFYNTKSSKLEENKQLEVNSTLTEALGKIVHTSFYYSFTSKVGHLHVHSFEEVVKYLYDFPESFYISKEEEVFYSKQELTYLRRVKKYLCFIGMKDKENEKKSSSRYKNRVHSKYENTYIYSFNDETIKNMINGKINFKVNDWYKEYSEKEKLKSKEYQALIVDKEDNFKMFVEFTNSEVKTYKDIKEVYTIENLKDDDKIIVTYFKILEIFL